MFCHACKIKKIMLIISQTSKVKLIATSLNPSITFSLNFYGISINVKKVTASVKFRSPKEEVKANSNRMLRCRQKHGQIKLSEIYRHPPPKFAQDVHPTWSPRAMLQLARQRQNSFGHSKPQCSSQQESCQEMIHTHMCLSNQCCNVQTKVQKSVKDLVSEDAERKQ